ncbi:MAG TPA: DUF5518 domain-containing protein [Vicinamibacterales bacterium]|nr:DUF5518 domain-containing protein [Vicinamibacterales bacterium]
MAANTTISYTRPALIGGAVMGVLTALPVVGLGNCACCLWVVGGGALAAYLLQQDNAAPISLADGALVGLLAGVFGAAVILVLSIPLMLLVEPIFRQFVTGVLERMENVPPEIRDLAMNRGFTAIRLIGQFVFWLVIGSLFSTIGGLVGASIFQKKLPPGTAPTIDVPPSPIS